MKEPSPSLEDAVMALLASAEGPDPERLQALAARHPEHAPALAAFAAEWLLQERLPADPADRARDDTEAERRVAAAMDRLRQRLDARAAGDAVDPFAGHSAAALRGVAADLGLDLTLIAKLRDRKIVAATVPAALSAALARALAVPLEAMLAHHAGPATVPAGSSFKAEEPPRAGAKERFADAVDRSCLDPAARARLLAGDR